MLFSVSVIAHKTQKRCRPDCCNYCAGFGKGNCRERRSGAHVYDPTTCSMNETRCNAGSGVFQLADQICNYNRHFAEYAGYFSKTDWLAQVDKTKETTYYDSVTVCVPPFLSMFQGVRGCRENMLFRSCCPQTRHHTTDCAQAERSR
jgi:hypothetical protein